MTALFRWLLVPTFVTGLLLAGPTPVARADVRDDGKYFSKETIDKANDLIRQIQKDTSKDVVVETFAEAPAGKKDALRGANGKKALEEWAAERARDRKVNGVFILMCKDPPRIQVEAGPETRRKAFTTADTEKLFGIIRDNFKERKFDDGLLAGLRFVDERMKENLKGEKISAPSASEDFIKDDGKYFSDDTKRKAVGIIDGIHKRWKKEVVVETLAKKPDSAANLKEYARQRARERRVNGVFILACRDPKDIEVEVGEETRRKAFTLDDTNRLYDILKKDFSKGKFDDGLIEGLNYVRDTMDKNLASGSAAPAPAPAGPNNHRGGPMHAGTNWLGLLCPILIVIGVVWLVIGLIRAFTSRPSYGPGPGGPGPGYGGPGYGGGGGGGFMTGLLGGLFGAVAGNWLYNNMFGGSHGSSWGSSSAYGSSPPAGGGDDAGTLRSDEGRDFSGTGGSYGDDSGGGAGGDYGDSGGGSGGDYGGGGDDYAGGSGGDYGGDSGGGDYGGGGGDFGGGGGDFGGGGGDY